jgi:hypothetical protein
MTLIRIKKWDLNVLLLPVWWYGKEIPVRKPCKKRVPSKTLQAQVMRGCKQGPWWSKEYFTTMTSILATVGDSLSRESAKSLRMAVFRILSTPGGADRTVLKRRTGILGSQVSAKLPWW